MAKQNTNSSFLCVHLEIYPMSWVLPHETRLGTGMSVYSTAVSDTGDIQCGYARRNNHRRALTAAVSSRGSSRKLVAVFCFASPGLRLLIPEYKS